jgi:hypothetical protein
MSTEEKHEGITSKIRERLEHTKAAVKEKVNPYSQTNKAARQENKQHKQEIEKTEREAYRKEEITQAATRGKQAAQKHYTPQPNHHATRASNFAEGATRTGNKYIFGSGASSTSVYGGLSLFQPAPKKKPVPQRITRVSKNGTVTITEPAQETKKEPRQNSYNPMDFGDMQTIHTPYSANPFDIDIVKPQPYTKGRGKKGKPKHAQRQWRIGDLI